MRFAIPAFVALLTVLALSPAGAATQPVPAAKPDLRRQVIEAESSFAHTMAARDSAEFGTYVALDAIFFGRRGALRGRDAVVAAWMPFFRGAQAPFSWRPEVVEVLSSGSLALSSGPVTDPDGKLIAVFNSIWRLEPDGRWRVVFDKGCPVCDSTSNE